MGRGARQEIFAMVKDALRHASDDEARRELIDARNQADSLAYHVEKTINENREKVAVGELSRIETAIAQVRKVAQTNDLAAIRKATDELQRVSHSLAEQLYKGSEGSKGSAGSAGSSGSAGARSSDVADGEVVDAEFAETR